MSKAKSTALQNAHELIERGELEAAQELLVPLLESDADDAGVWWVYAHAVRDIGIGQAALRRVLELDPLYPGARELAQDMNRVEAPLLTANPLTANESVDAQRADIDIDDWEDLQPAVGAPQTNQQSARIGTTVLVTALLLLIVGGVLIATGAIDINQLLSGILSTPQPSTLVEAPAQPSDSDTFSIGTAVPQEEISPLSTMQDQAAAGVEIAGTLVPEQTTEPTPTFAPSPTYVPLPKAESDFVQRVAQQIDEFSLDAQQSFLIYSNAGNTLVLQTCALPGADFNAKVASMIQAVVTLADKIPAELDALAAGLLNCDDPGASLHLIGTEARLIRDFASGAIDDRDFQREWKQLAEAPREATVSPVIEEPVVTATAEAPEVMPEAAVEIAATATDQPAQTVEPAPKLAPSPTFVPLPRAESDFVQQVTQQIRGFTLDPKQAFLRDSDAGNTLVLQTCALPGADFNSKIASIMQVVVTLADEIPAELDAVAAGLLNCDDPGARLRLIGLEVHFFRDFASGAIDDRAFQREWKQLG